MYRDNTLWRFVPKRTDDLKKAALPFVGKIVTVRSWHTNVSMTTNYPDDELVGLVEEFGLDIPESELVEVDHGVAGHEEGSDEVDTKDA